MKVPFLDLKSEYKFLEKEINKNLQACLASQGWILGPEVSEFEKRCADYLGIRHTVSVASGTDALLIGLRALSLTLKNKGFFEPKDEIITTPFTFIATAEAIIRAGAKPVFVDIEPGSFNLDPKAIAKAITKNTVGILPVHLYGQSCNMAEIKKIARNKRLFILEDCAQSFGADYKKKKLGTLAEAGAFSFFPSKNLGGFGDGGLVTTKTKKAADLIRVLRNHGQTAQYKAGYCGYNSRLDSVQAAVLLAKLKHIDKFNRRRIQIAFKYNEAFKGIFQIQTPSLKQETFDSKFRHVYHLYTLKVPALIRDKLVKSLNRKGVPARVYYPVSLNRMKAFSKAKVLYPLKNTEQAVKEVISLPIYPFMEENKVNYVVEAVRSSLLSCRIKANNR